MPMLWCAATATVLAAWLLLSTRQQKREVVVSEEEEEDEVMVEEESMPRAPRLRTVDGQLRPVDESEALRWLAATQVGFLLDGDAAWASELLSRIRWEEARHGETVVARGEPCERLLVVVHGALDLLAAPHDDHEVVGLDLDDDVDGETLEVRLQVLEAVGKLSVAVAAGGRIARPSRHRIAAACDGTIVASLGAEDLKTLGYTRPAALLAYARRCVARLHRVARFANSELVPHDVGPTLDAAPFDYFASVDDFEWRSERGGLRILARGEARRGAEVVKAPAVLDGFAFLDEASTQEDDGLVADGTVYAFDDADFSVEDSRLRVVLAEAVLAVIAEVDVVVRAFSASGMSRRWLPAGATLLKRGDPAPAHFFVVISGRVRSSDGDVGRGGTVGLEDAAVAQRVSATAECDRDTEVVAVPTAALGRGAALWLKKLAKARTSVLTAASVTTIAVFGADDAGRRAAASVSPLLARALGPDVLRASESAVFATTEDCGVSYRCAYQRRVASAWLAASEERHRHVVLECQDSTGAEASRLWTRFATSQADAVLVVVDADASTKRAPSAFERELLWGDHPRRRHRRIFVVAWHHIAGVVPGSSKQWLAKRPTTSHPRLVHVAKDSRGDHERLARIAAGRARAVVLGGGGSRGLAHLGVLDALRSNGYASIDLVAGCSQGAFMAAAYALPADDSKRLQSVKLAAASFARRLTNPLALMKDLNLWPLLSFFDGRGFSRAVSDALGGTTYDIEDCWLPFFCVTTNLTRQRGEIRCAGTLSFAVRASMSVAELLPPARDPDTGHLHVDGCYTSNLPAAEMRSVFQARVVVAVSVVDTSGAEFQGVVPYGADGVSGFWLVTQRFQNIFRSTRPKVPSMSKVRAVLQVLRNKAQLRDAIDRGVMDLFLEIEPVSDYSAASYWRRIDRIAETARDYAAPRIKLWASQNHDELRAWSSQIMTQGGRNNSSLPALASLLHGDAMAAHHTTGGGAYYGTPPLPRHHRRGTSSSLAVVDHHHPPARRQPRTRGDDTGLQGGGPPAPTSPFSSSSRHDSYLSW